MRRESREYCKDRPSLDGNWREGVKIDPFLLQIREKKKIQLFRALVSFGVTVEFFKTSTSVRTGISDCRYIGGDP